MGHALALLVVPSPAASRDDAAGQMPRLQRTDVRGPDFREAHMSRHRSRGQLDPPPAVMARLRKAYVESDVPVRDIHRRFGVNTRRLAEIARREGWPMRRKAREQGATAR